MSNVNVNSQVAVRVVGIQALVESLGPVGFARFIQQFETGYGDYTKEKYLGQEPSMDEIDQELQKYM